MNKKKILKWTCITACIVLILSIAFTSQGVLADVGNNNRYESSSSSSYEGDSGDVEGLFYLVWFLFDVFGPIPGLIILAIIGVVFFVVRKAKIKHKNFDDMFTPLELANADATFMNNDNFNNTDEVAEEIRKIDPKFSSDAFIGWSREVFLKIQKAWSDRKWEEIRPFESNELFSQHSAQLQEYIDNHKINKIEKIAIKHVSLNSFMVDGDKEVLTVHLDAVMRDYVVDDTTNKVLESDPNKDWHMRYVMTFNRKAGVKTEPGLSNKSVTNCPNCGAPTEITSAGKCEYCKSVITTGDHDWVLSDIRSRD